MQLHCLLFHFPGFVLDWQQQVNSQLNNRPIIARLFGILLSGAVGGKYPKKAKKGKRKRRNFSTKTNKGTMDLKKATVVEACQGRLILTLLPARPGMSSEAPATSR